MLSQEQAMAVNLYTKSVSTCKNHTENEENPLSLVIKRMLEGLTGCRTWFLFCSLLQDRYAGA